MMTVKQYVELQKRLGKEVTEEQATGIVNEINRKVGIYNHLVDRLKKDRKKSIQILITRATVDGKAEMALKFVNLDRPKAWEYMDELLDKYCETLMEVKRTKTTLTAVL